MLFFLWYFGQKWMSSKCVKEREKKNERDIIPYKCKRARCDMSSIFQFVSRCVIRVWSRSIWPAAKMWLEFSMNFQDFCGVFCLFLFLIDSRFVPHTDYCYHPSWKFWIYSRNMVIPVLNSYLVAFRSVGFLSRHTERDETGFVPANAMIFHCAQRTGKTTQTHSTRHNQKYDRKKRIFDQLWQKFL